MSQAPPLSLPPGITSRIITDVNGLDMHVLESGSHPEENDHPKRPLLLLLHGFPELAYSYRKVIVPLSLAGSGYHVVAPDQRGYGRTTRWDETDLTSFRMINLVTDIVALVLALGYRTVECIIGHDFGSPVAAYCALIRPDMFRSVVMMSAPFPGAPSFIPRGDQTGTSSFPTSLAELARDLSSLTPPRTHYQQYLSPPSLQANRDMLHAPQGLSSFLRAFYHMKSADWTLNDPHPLLSWSAHEIAKMPEYYILHTNKSMPQTVLPHLPSTDDSPCTWLTESELSVYVDEFSRTAFQGGLNWYQFTTSLQPELCVFSEKRVDVPALFIAGEKDWGMYQVPGNLQRMQDVVCRKMRPGKEGCCVVKGAGHWVQQEQPDEVVRLITRFIAGNLPGDSVGDEKET